MQEPIQPPKKKRFNLSQEDMMVIFVSGIIIMAVGFTLLNFPLIYAIPINAVLLFSLYYQIMFWINQINSISLQMRIEDKYLNEFGYQVLKHGHTLKVSTIQKNPDDPNSDLKYKFDSNMPKWTKKYLRCITIIHLILFPAWRFREYEGEDKMME